MDELCGVINIYKEKGYTSHDVVAIVRRLLGRIKTGHTGTLDPAACGVLPICIGRATKIADYIMTQSKGYRAVVRLGQTTDTEDETGNITEVRDVNCSREQIESAVASFKGIYEQIPPMYSAIKIDGKRLYELARKGEEIERAKRSVVIEEIKILEFLDDKSFRIDVRCSKGTYIRTICADIGRILGCGACMGDLLRYANGDFKQEDSIRLSELENAIGNGTLSRFIIPVETVLSHFTRVTVLERYNKALYNGNIILPDYLTPGQAQFSPDENVLVFSGDGKLVGIYAWVFDIGQKYLKAKVVLFGGL